MKKSYRERIQEGLLLFDSAMGTAIYDKGIFINRCFEEVNLTKPEIVLEIHRDNVAAGAQALTANTFAANPIKLAGYNLAEKTEEINTRGITLAREAAGEDIYVAGSVGPLGRGIEPLGKLSVEEARQAFMRQIKAQVEAGADLLIFETFKNIEELILAIDTARQISVEIPIHAHFSLGALAHPSSGGVLEEYSRNYLQKAVDIAMRLDRHPGIDVIGSNCGVGPADMLELLTAIKRHVAKPIAILPNAGFPKDVDGRQFYLADPDYFAEYALRFVDAGADVIGGCCGTTPAHIAKMGKAVLNLSGSRHKVTQVLGSSAAETAQPIPLRDRSGLGSALARKEWVTTIELIPPMGTGLDKIIKKSRDLVGPGVTTINLPDGPRASSRISPIITALELMRQTGAEPLVHICCRDKNLIALQADLLGCQAVGLHDLLLITGDPPKVGNYPDATGVFDVDSVGLLSLGNRLNHGVDLGGNAIGAPTSFVMGAGINPVSPTIETEIERAFQKAEAGADFFITQPAFDAESLLSFLEKIKDTRVPVIIGVWPFASYRNALFLKNEVPGVIIPDRVMERMSKPETKEEARKEGVRIARKIVEELRPSAAGVQVSPPFGNVQTALDVIAEDFK